MLNMYIVHHIDLRTFLHYILHTCQPCSNVPSTTYGYLTYYNSTFKRILHSKTFLCGQV